VSLYYGRVSAEMRLSGNPGYGQKPPSCDGGHIGPGLFGITRKA
jgi:hypothetical protein